MQIVIDINTVDYEYIKNGCIIPIKIDTHIYDAIRNGSPLPKGHGRLIDADAFIKKLQNVSEKQKYKELLIDNHLTVDDVFKAVIESLQNEGLANGDAPTIIGTEME